MVMEEFGRFPVYCMRSGTVAKQPVVGTGKSCGELGTEPQGDNPMVTPDRKRCKRIENPASEEKHTQIVVWSEPNANQFLALPDFGSFKFKSDVDGKSSGDILTALATTPPAAAATKQKKGCKKSQGEGVC